MNRINIGEFVYGDPESDVLVSLLDDRGDPIPLWGLLTAELVCKTTANEGAALIGEIAGSPDLGQLVFEGLGLIAAPTPARPSLKFEARVKVTGIDDLLWSRDAVIFTVALYP